MDTLIYKSGCVTSFRNATWSTEIDVNTKLKISLNSDGFSAGSLAELSLYVTTGGIPLVFDFKEWKDQNFFELFFRSSDNDFNDNDSLFPSLIV